jgi:hypothetical protein
MREAREAIDRLGVGLKHGNEPGVKHPATLSMFLSPLWA